MAAATDRIVCPRCRQPRDPADFFSEATGRPVRTCLACRVAKADPRSKRRRRGWPPEAVAAAAELKRQQTKAKLAAGIKHCTNCERDLPIELFRARNSAGVGRSPVCLSCEAEVAREWRRRRRQQQAQAIAAVTAARHRTRNAVPEELPCCGGQFAEGRAVHDAACALRSLQPRLVRA